MIYRRWIKEQLNEETHLKIEFIAQPPRPLDLNVLDLGIWNGVDKARKEPQTGTGKK